MRRLLLTGAGGFLGQQIARSLLAAGCESLRLHVRNQLPAKLLAALREEFPAARIEVVAANLLARGSLGAIVEGVDAIVHAAAGMRGAAADMFANTVVATRNLLEAAAEHKVRRIVLVSSFSVYRTETLAADALLDEATPVEPVAASKGPYAYAKTRQEALLREFEQSHGFETVILRPGVIYGPGGGALSPRVGIQALGLFFGLGGRALLPLTYVGNCADAVALAALKAAPGSVLNVVDDGLPRCCDYLARYRRDVRRLRVVPLPYPVLLLGARWLERYHRASQGQLPAVFTHYVVRSMYRPLRYSNAALKRLGWAQSVPTPEALALTMRDLRTRPER